MKVFFLLLLPMALFAKPQHLEVQHGSASIHEKGNHTLIENSPNAILHWQDFSIAQEESVHFAQEHAKSTVLNRVSSGQTSHLLGKLTSNGAVFLINPRGVLIGTDAQISTAGFLASTADISNEDFLKGHYLFSNPAEGHITNHGVIECPQGDIYLIAKTIHNTGVLQGENISEVSAYEVLITPSANEKVAIRTELDESEITILTHDLATTNPYEKAIHHTGEIQAFGSKEENGKVYLIAQKRETVVEGSIEAPSGDVQVVGEEVCITETSTLDVSGTCGGTILIGGDYKGENPEIMNAQRVIVDQSASILADGYAGNGGKVILWGDSSMAFRGNVSAQALGEHGDGGFVEISSLGCFYYGGHVNTLSSHGLPGTLLLDPVNITINTGGPTNPPLSGGPTVYTPGVDATIEDSVLASSLGTGSVTLNTSGGVGGGGTVEFNANTNVTWAQNTTLTVNADRNIVVRSNATIQNTFSTTGFDAVVLNANLAGTATGGSGVAINGGNILTEGGNVSLNGKNGGSISSKGVTVIGDGSIQTTGGNISLVGEGGGAANTDGVTVGTGGGGGSTGTLISTTGSITIHGSVRDSSSSQSYQSTRSLIQTDSGEVTIIGTGNEGTIAIDAGSTIQTDSGGIHLSSLPSPVGQGVIVILSSALITSNSGGIFMEAPDGGIRLVNGATVRTSGEILFEGSSAFGAGILIDSSSLVSETGIQPITFNGTGLQGITITGSNTSVQSTNSNVILRGVGQGLGTNADGIQVLSGGQVFNGGNGQVMLNGTGSLNGGGSSRGIFVSGTESLVRSISGDIILEGAGGSGGDGNNGIEVSSGGDITSTDGTIRSTITSLGGTGSANCHGILVNGIGSTITTTNGAVNLEGTGGGSTAPNHGIFVTGGGQISSTGPLFQLTGTGSGTGSSNSGINLNNATISQVVTDVTLTGTGSPNGLDNNYGIELSNGTGITTNSGGINLTANGRGTGQNNHGIFFTSAGNITSTSGDIVINASGSNAGTDRCMGLLVDGVGTEITSDTGSVSVTGIGGGNGVDNHGVLLSNQGKIYSSDTAPVSVTGTGSSFGGVGIYMTGVNAEISSNSGAVSITGTAGGAALEGITIEDQARVFTAGAIGVTTFSDLLISNNSSINSQGNAPFTLNVATDVRILGGAGAAPAYINLTDGTATFTIGRDLILQGGSGVDSQAQIGNVGLSPSASSPITVQVGRDVILTGGVSPSQIGHLNNAGSTLGGDINITCQNDLSVIGGTDLNGFARIGHGGQLDAATYDPSTMQLIAGRDINITSNVGDAQVVNENGPLTLVVDNLFPTSPGIGPGAFNLNSTLTATGELRIYTAREELNTINDTINGVVFVPGPFDVNTDTEQWNTYFPSGTYEGAAFKFYYKDPPVDFPAELAVTPQIVRTFFGDVAANLVELPEILPIFQSLRAPRRFPNYHFKLCLEEEKERKCDPDFSPYGSFIFEDDVWWIGGGFTYR